MNPLIGPKLPKNTILMMAREWVNVFPYYDSTDIATRLVLIRYYISQQHFLQSNVQFE